MNIGIDARGLLEKKAGIGKYIEQIIKKINEMDKDNNYILYSTKEIVLDFKLKNNFQIKQKLGKLGSLWMFFCLPKHLKDDKIDVFWGTQALLPRKNKYTKKIRYILTIHDLAIKRLKVVGSFKNTIIQKLFLKSSIKKADRIITISKSTQKDIISFYNIDINKTSVIYPGTNIQENIEDISPKTKEEIEEKMKIKNMPYIFFLSTIEPRKNIKTLIKSFEYIRKKNNINLKLILAGGLGWKYNDILEEVDKSSYKDDIIMPGYISEEEKKYLYENTKCFVYPSLYEGFGLPVLEAMANKSLVVTSNNSSLPEVGGDVAFYYNRSIRL